MTEAPPSAGQTKGARPVTVGMVFVPYEVQRSRRAAELLAPFIANPGVNVLPTFALYPLVAFLPLPGGSRGWLLALGLPVLSICAEDEIRALLVHSWARFVRPGIPAGLWLAKLGAQIRRRMDSARIDEIAPLIYLTLDRFGDVADRCTALNASYAEEEAGRSTSKETFARARRALELAVRYWNPFVQQKLAPALRYGMLPPVANGFREYLSHVAPDVYSKVAPNPVALALENLWPTERKLCSAIIGEAANELRMCHWEDLPAEVLVSHWTSEGLKGFWAF